MRQLVIILGFLTCTFSFSQNQKLKAQRIDSIAIKAERFIGFDAFRNYFFLKNNVVYKKSAGSILQYQNISLGNITKVDLLNPLKIIVFYEQFNTVVLLDSQLNEIQKVDFSLLQTPLVAAAIGIAGQNQLWLYNSMNQQIGLYDLASNQYKTIGLPLKTGFIHYQTDYNSFQWIDKQNEWFSCTLFGRVVSKGIVDSSKQVQYISENTLLFSNGQTIFMQDRTTNVVFEIEIVEKSFENFYYKDQILAIFTPQGITNYKITIP